MKNNLRQYAPFIGDGRFKINPINSPNGTSPKRITRSLANIIFDSFMEKGFSHHSASGSTVWVIITGCLSNKISHNITTVFDSEGEIIGWTIKKNALPK